MFIIDNQDESLCIAACFSGQLWPHNGHLKTEFPPEKSSGIIPVGHNIQNVAHHVRLILKQKEEF